jgi:hypothetical protein
MVRIEILWSYKSDFVQKKKSKLQKIYLSNDFPFKKDIQDLKKILEFQGEETKKFL